MGFCSGQKPLSSVKPWQSELAVLFRAVRFVARMESRRPQNLARRAAWLCPPLRSTPASLAPTRSVPFPGRCTVVRRPRGGRPLPRGTSCAAPPQAVLTLRQALVGFFQAEALRLQGAVFLQPAVDAFQTLVERFAQRLPSVGLRLRVGGRQHSEEGLHLNERAHGFSLFWRFNMSR